MKGTSRSEKVTLASSRCPDWGLGLPEMSLFVKVDVTLAVAVSVSKCASEAWDKMSDAERIETFEKHKIAEHDYMNNAKQLVGKGELIYKVNGSFLKEIDAWQAILAMKISGINIIPNQPTTSSVDGKENDNRSGEKTFNAYRPGSDALRAMNLNMGENTLVYEYFISETVKDTISVKIFVYPPKTKIIISDIDGTITK